MRQFVRLTTPYVKLPSYTMGPRDLKASSTHSPPKPLVKRHSEN